MRPANEGFKVKSKIDFMEITETHQLSGTPKKKDGKPLAAHSDLFFAYQKEKCSFTIFYESVFWGFSLLRVLQLRADRKRIINEGN